MMARKDRFPIGFSAGYSPNYGSEGSGSSGRVDTEITVSENSRALKRKVFNLNLGVPTQVLPLSRMSPAERKNLVWRLKSELEQIRVFHKRVEMHRTNSIALSSSSDILSCSNIGKSALLDSEPGRNVNPPGTKAARGWNRGTSGRFASSDLPLPSTANAILMKQCEALLKKLMQHQYGWVFNTPVDVVKLNIPDYFTVIKHPMDLGTIKRKIESGEYASPLDFAADVRLTFSNAMTYNPRGNDVHLMADNLSKFFEVRWKVIQKKLEKDSQPVQEKSGVYEEKEAVKPTPPSKKRKISSVNHKPLQKPVVRKMSNEDKLKLSGELEELLGELPDNIVEFLKDQTLNGRETGVEEIEIDIDVLSDDTLFKLRKLMDDYIHNKQKNQAKAEPCEIELLNDSGPSNSSMLLYKGNDPVDEDIDIGGNEPPVSSCPPVKIDHDAGHRSTSNGHSDLDSSNSGKESNGVKAQEKPTKENSGTEVDVDGNTESVIGLEQPEINSENLNSANSDWLPDGESAGNERQVSPERLYRAALLKNRFADTILKAREKTLIQGEKGDPDKMRRAREELELQKKKEKARLQAEAKAAEDARRRAEAMAEAEAKRKRDLEREAARQALQMMEKTVEINENSRFLEDLEMLRAVPPEQLPSSADEASPEQSQDPLGSFNFRGSNALEQLGLFMKLDDEEEEGEPPGNIRNIVDDVEEGEVDEEEGQPPKTSIVDDVEEGEMGECHKEGEPLKNIPGSVEDGEMGEDHEEGELPNNIPGFIDDVEEGKMGDEYKDLVKAVDNISSIANHVEAEEMDEDHEVGEPLDHITSVDEVDVEAMDEDHIEGGPLKDISRLVDNVEEGEMGKADEEGNAPENVLNIVDDVDVDVREMDEDHEERGSLNDFSRIVDHVEEGETGKVDKEGDAPNNLAGIVDDVDVEEMDEGHEEVGSLNDLSKIVDSVDEREVDKDEEEGDAPKNIPSIVDVDVVEMHEDHEEDGSLNNFSPIVKDGEMGEDKKEADVPCNVPSIVDDVDVREMNKDNAEGELYSDSISRIIDDVKEGEMSKDGPSIVDVGEMDEGHEEGASLNDLSSIVDIVEEGEGKVYKEGDAPYNIPSIVGDVDFREMDEDNAEDGSHSDISRIIDNVKEEEMSKDNKEGDVPNNIPSIVDDLDLGEMDEGHEEGDILNDLSRIVDHVEEWAGTVYREGDAPYDIPSIVDDVDIEEMGKNEKEGIPADHVDGGSLNYTSRVFDNVEVELGDGDNKEGDVPCNIPNIVGDVDVVEMHKEREEEDISRIVDMVEEADEMSKVDKEGSSPTTIPSTVTDVDVGEIPKDHEEEGPLVNDSLRTVDNVDEMGKDNEEGDASYDVPDIVTDVDVGETHLDHEEIDIFRIVGNVEEQELVKDDKEGDAPPNDTPSIAVDMVPNNTSSIVGVDDGEVG